MNLPRRRLLQGTAAGLLAPLAPATAGPANAPWPQQGLQLIAVYPPGGVSDVTARAIALQLARQLKAAVRVENRAGQGGALGLATLARAAPDGHVLAFSAVTPLTLMPHLMKLGYDPLHDIAPVMGVMITPALLVSTPAFAGNSFADLLARAAGPLPLRWATSGRATTGHLILEQVRLATRADIVHVPYKGGGQQINDALAGHFELLSTNVGTAQLQYIRQGRLKPLAVGAPKRLPHLPEVPTFAELGYPAANLSSLFGIFAPGKTPPEVVRRLNTELNTVLASDDVRRLLLAVDNIPVGGSATEFAQAIRREWEANQRLAREVRLLDG